jgi:hypothetical protein
MGDDRRIFRVPEERRATEVQLAILEELILHQKGTKTHATANPRQPRSASCSGCSQHSIDQSAVALLRVCISSSRMHSPAPIRIRAMSSPRSRVSATAAHRHRCTCRGCHRQHAGRTRRRPKSRPSRHAAERAASFGRRNGPNRLTPFAVATLGSGRPKLPLPLLVSAVMNYERFGTTNALSSSGSIPERSASRTVTYRQTMQRLWRQILKA